MNMISQLRQLIRQNGSATISAEQYDQLQAEWITRARINTEIDRAAFEAAFPPPDGVAYIENGPYADRYMMVSKHSVRPTTIIPSDVAALYDAKWDGWKAKS